MTRRSLGAHLRWWLAGFLAVATVSVWYFHAPLLPVVLAGVVTLLVTIVRSRPQ